MIEHLAPVVAWMALGALGLAACLVMAVVGQRIVLARRRKRLARVTQYFDPLLRKALTGDPGALRPLLASPASYRVTIATMLITPLIEDRDPTRVAAARVVFKAMSLLPVADRLLESRQSWRRALGMRALGLIRQVDRSDLIVAGLDDPDPHVRSAALEVLADMKYPPTIGAIVVRLNDTTLPAAQRVQALMAFGAQAEPFVLELAEVDLDHLAHYARALKICGTARCHPVLCGWMTSAETEVRVATLEALAHVGLDETSSALAVRALDGSDPRERAAAAAALHGWTGTGDAAVALARHLDDAWVVAVRSARTLQTLGLPGRHELEASAVRSDVAGALARQVLRESGVRP